ncbi:MAG: HutD family protein [Proteobacteria bacterium]|nr:HutD family protein [Pseudomonadota bacterium]
MQLLRSSDYKCMPWKNGGGETIEIMVSPPAADFTSMDWRLSMATVASDGPFSSFPGIDRTLSVLSGTLRLSIDGAHVDLMEMSPPHSFSGDAVTHGAVLRGPVTDLNVMTRRADFMHQVRRLSVMGEKTVTAAPGTLVLFCHTGSVRLPDGETLKARDTAVGVSPGGTMTFRADVLSTLYVITITPR